MICKYSLNHAILMKILNNLLVYLRHTQDIHNLNLIFFLISISWIGIEGVSSLMWHSLGSNLKIPAKVVQLMKSKDESDLNAIANSVREDVTRLVDGQKRYLIVGHSFGTLTAMKLASSLEKRGKLGHLVIIDGSPRYLIKLLHGLRRNTSQTDNLENDLIMILYTHFCNTDQLDVFIKKLAQCDKISSKVELIADFVSPELKTTYSAKYVLNLIVAVFNRLKALVKFNALFDNTDELTAMIDSKLKSPITLIRPTQTAIADISEDYDLHKFSECEVNVRYVDGNHLTVIENVELSNILNDLISSEIADS